MAVKKARAAKVAGLSPAGRDKAKLLLWLRNESGRDDVPLRGAFERWLGVIPQLRQRRRSTTLNILIVDGNAGRSFNRRFRQRDYATNVLSFAGESAPGSLAHVLGDLVICAPVVAREAREQRKPVSDHYAHMAIHGALHLLGQDHENDDDAKRMEEIERKALASLGIADPYGAR